MSTATKKTTKSKSTSKTTKAATTPGNAAPTSALDGSAPAAAKQAEPTVVDAPQAVILGPMMRKKELIDAVVQRSGMKKKDVKPAVEMMLSVMGEAIGDNRELNLPPFGRLKIRREKKLANGRIVVAKIRQSTPSDNADASKGSDDPDI
ncbi:HU family DNA-binding protein [Sulfitobacter sp. F26204]|uniref:HU family DNA-binding protein n=1 Tax=Sulfitobacter sp. F26204 TaxID=2996014 RepID=UPI00225DE5FC|nr:HU family DNA-binding protein [Sulfitobacter sp. F26204]MCX7559996.1 HU family DNA-binding protein [Sulfitobacter sp. F26204]